MQESPDLPSSPAGLERSHARMRTALARHATALVLFLGLLLQVSYLPLHAVEPGLVGHWPLEEGAGATTTSHLFNECLSIAFVNPFQDAIKVRRDRGAIEQLRE